MSNLLFEIVLLAKKLILVVLNLKRLVGYWFLCVLCVAVGAFSTCLLTWLDSVCGSFAPYSDSNFDLLLLEKKLGEIIGL